MKKILISSAICLSIVGCKEKINMNQVEIDNTCDDLLNYLYVDLEEGRIDSTIFKSYTWNIKEIKQRNNE
jgi:hypothetical protein